jgi:hypothetical protein
MGASRRQTILIGVALALLLTGSAARWQLARRSGLTRTVFGDTGFAGSPLRIDRTTDVDLKFLDEDRHLPRRFFSARWQGVWYVTEPGTYRLHAGGDDRVAVSIDGRRMIERQNPAATGTVELPLNVGPHGIIVEYEQVGGGAFLTLRTSKGGEPPQPLPPHRLFPDTPTSGTRRLVAVLRPLRWGAWAGATLLALAALVLVARVARPAIANRRVRIALALIAVTLLAAALRLDALLARYGPLERPAWASELQIHGADRLALLRPDGFGWAHEPRPYVGGDPITYLRFAREMRHFYAAHVREPLFVYATRLWLAALDNQDVAISFASLGFSLLLVVATYLLGAAAFSPMVGLAAAFAIAIERDAILWGVEGWRDDAFAGFVVLFAWALVRCQRAPTVFNGMLAGIIGAAACLTRLSALTFIVPGFVALIGTAEALPRADHAGQAFRPAVAAAIALVTTTLLIAPYLINCAREFGDPFYAVNYHTTFYQRREARARRDTSATGYVGGKLARQPLRSLRVGATGLTTYPFLNKWRGFDAWVPGVGWLIATGAVVGLVMWLRSRVGRLLLVVLVTSLAPYALTWPIRGGAEWRFTLHAYPFYLIAATTGVVPAFRLAMSFRRTSWKGHRVLGGWGKPRPYAVAGIVVLVAVAMFCVRWWPWLEFREALSAREAATIEFGERDTPFLSGGWSPPLRSGDRRVRYATAIRSTVRVPLPERRAYRLRLRLDPFELERRQRITVFVNAAPIGTILAGETAETDGAYELLMPVAAVREGTNRIELLATHVVPARILRSRAAGLKDDEAAAFRMWEVTVLDFRAP